KGDRTCIQEEKAGRLECTAVGAPQQQTVRRTPLHSELRSGLAAEISVVVITTGKGQRQPIAHLRARTTSQKRNARLAKQRIAEAGECPVRVGRKEWGVDDVGEQLVLGVFAAQNCLNRA